VTAGSVEDGEALPSAGGESAPVETDDAAETLTLPDERHSRTTELAARLRQSALAQVEAAQAAQAASGAISAPTTSSGPKIPALDDPSRRFAVTPMPPATPIAAGEPVVADEGDAPSEPAAPVAAAEPIVATEPVEAEPIKAGAPDELPAPGPVTVDDEPAAATVEPERAADPEVAAADDASDHALRVAAAGLPVESFEDEPAYLSGPLGPGDAGPGGRRLIWATAVVAVLALASAALLVIFMVKDSRDVAVAKARVGALAAAKTEMATLLTYNYQTLDSDIAKAEAGMSKSFRVDYAHTATASLTPLAKKEHSVTTATIVAAAVSAATPNSAQVLVYADQTVENKLLNATSRLDTSIVAVSMVKQDGRWVINELTTY
jgi:Mce-associated membrane protein